MKPRILFAFSVASSILVALPAIALPAPSLGTTEVIALSGGAAPGGGKYEYFSEPVINNQGHVAYSAGLEGIAAGQPSGVFRYDGVTTAVIGGPSHFVGGARLHSAGQPALNETGEVTFHGVTLPNTKLVLKGSGGELTSIARVGQAAPGGGTFAYLPIDPRINDVGQVAVAVSFNPTTGVTGGVYRHSGGALTEIARLDRPAPVGGRYREFHWAFPINNSGEVAFAAFTTNAESSGIFRGNGNATVKIASDGELAPDGDGAYIGLGFSTPALNDSGQVAFVSNVRTDTGPVYTGVFRGSGGTLTQIARGGQLTPSGNEIFRYFGYGPVINERGEAAFGAFLEDPANPADPFIAIYRGDGTTLTEAMRAGNAPPDGNGGFLDFGNPEMNNHGQIAVMAQLGQTQNGTGDDQGLYFYSDLTGLVQVAREGQPLLGSTITSLLFTGGLNRVESTGDEAMGMNDLGQVAFSFRLADGRSGVAVWQIPEPTAGAMLLIALLHSVISLRRRF